MLQYFLLYLMRSMGKVIYIIGLAASSTSKDPQVKTMEPIVKIKVTNCSIQLGWILARDVFFKNYMGSRPEAKKCIFSFSACGCMYEWMLSFFSSAIFSTPLNRLKWNWKPTNCRWTLCVWFTSESTTENLSNTKYLYLYILNRRRWITNEYIN